MIDKRLHHSTWCSKTRYCYILISACYIRFSVWIFAFKGPIIHLFTSQRSVGNPNALTQLWHEHSFRSDAYHLEICLEWRWNSEDETDKWTNLTHTDMWKLIPGEENIRLLTHTICLPSVYTYTCINYTKYTNNHTHIININTYTCKYIFNNKLMCMYCMHWIFSDCTLLHKVTVT